MQEETPQQFGREDDWSGKRWLPRCKLGAAPALQAQMMTAGRPCRSPTYEYRQPFETLADPPSPCTNSTLTLRARYQSSDPHKFYSSLPRRRQQLAGRRLCIILILLYDVSHLRNNHLLCVPDCHCSNCDSAADDIRANP